MRKLLKKSMACCLIIALCFTMVFGAISVSAATTATAVVGTVSAANDELTVDLPITVTAEGDSGINVATLTVNLPKCEDKYLSTITAISAVGADVSWKTGDTTVSDTTADDFVAPVIVNNKFVIMLNAIESTGIFTEATVTVTFAVLDADEGVYDVSIAASEAVDNNKVEANDVAISATAGSITVTLGEHTCASTDENYTSDENTHWKECDICGKKVEEAEHSWDEGVITQQPNCSISGIKEYTCTVCGYKLEEDLFERDSHPEIIIDVAVDPTCTETGLTEGSHCAVCTEVIVAQEVVPALGHNEVFTDNGNGTHDGTCDRVGCGIVVTDNEAHIDANADNVCDKCSATIAVPCEHKNTTFVSATPAVEDGSTGNIKLVCADCGKEVDKTVTYLRNSQLAGSNGTLSLGQITEFKLRLNNNNYGSLNAKDAYVVYTQIDVNGNVYKTEAINISEFVLEGSYYVNFVPVDFDRMCDVFKINVYRQESTGEWVSGLEREYSVKNSAMSIVKGTNAQAEKVAAANLLKAGAESQRYVNKTVAAEKCADYELTGEYAEFVTTTVPSVVVDDTNWIKTTGHADNKEGYFATPGAILGAKVQISVKADVRYYEEEITDLKIVCTYTSYDKTTVTETITAEDYTFSGTRAEFGYGLMAPDMRAPVSFQIFNGDTPISQVNVFSVEAILAKFLESNPDESAVVYALLNYSDAAARL